MELIDDDGRRAVDEHMQAELMERLTHPTGGSVTRTEEAHRAWVNRDLAPALHREAYLHALRDTGLPDHHAEALYQQAIDPASWVPYPDTVEVLRSLKAHGLRTAIVSNIAFDIRPAFRDRGCRGRRVRPVLRSRCGQTGSADLRDRAAAPRRHRRRGRDGRRQPRERRCRPRCRLRLHPGRPTARRRASDRADRRTARSRHRALGVPFAHGRLRAHQAAVVAQADEQDLHGGDAARHPVRRDGKPAWC